MTTTEGIDRTLAFTALIEMWPKRLTDDEAMPLRGELQQAMTAANPKDRWAFARQWIAGRLVAQADEGVKGPRPMPWPADVNYELALAIARSGHPSRVLAITNVYRYGKFTEGPAGQVLVHLMGNLIAVFSREGVRFSTCGWNTASTIEAFNALVSGGYFYRDKGEIIFSAYETTGTRRTGTKFVERGSYPYKQGARI